MAETIKEKAEAAGHKIAETATRVGNKVGEKVEEATDWTKEKAHQVGNRVEEAAQKVEHKAKETFGDSCGSDSTCGTGRSTSDIREHMDVIGSCGTKLGRVDHVQGSQIKLTKNDSPDGMHHLIPMSWVEDVDDQVHLSKTCGEASREWQTLVGGRGSPGSQHEPGNTPAHVFRSVLFGAPRPLATLPAIQEGGQRPR